MQQFIIGYGRREQLDVVSAPSKDEAQMIATRRSMDDGLLDDDLADTTWAEPYTDELAEEYGLAETRR